MTGTDRIGGALPRYVAILVAAVLGLSLFPGVANAQQQQQDPCADAPVANEYVDRETARDVHEPSIDCIIYRSIAVGSTNAQGQQVYQPLNPVTRGQMASFVAQTLVAAGYDSELPEGEGDDEFGDIAGNVHRLNINRLARAGIVNGIDENNYGPNGLITRQQMASFMVQAAEFALGRELQGDADFPFTDVSASNVHRENINRGEDNGLFRGVTATQFRPGLNVLRDQMATFLVNLLRLIFNPVTAPPVVRLTDASVAPGEPVTGEITGDARSAVVSGCGLNNQTVTDTNTNQAGIQFSVNIPTTQTTNCTLTFTITGANGDTFTRTANVTVTAAPTNQGVTRRPELVSATRVSTTTQQQASSTNPAGTRYEYCFDEAVEVSAFSGAGFFIVSVDGSQQEGSTGPADVRQGSSNRCVVVRFENVDTEAKANNYSVATVREGVVADQDPAGRRSNPEGDAPLGAERSSTTARTAETTDAPDARAVTGTRLSTGGNTAVDITFDENAIPTGAGGFRVIFTDNSTANCTGPAAGSTTASGGTQAGGAGTSTFTILCPNTSGNETPIALSEIARVVQLTGTVRDNETPANANPQQAFIPTGGTGNATNAPNLVSVAFRPSADTGPDLVDYTFDRQLADPAANPLVSFDPADFRIYLDSAEERLGLATGSGGQVTLSQDGRTVTVRFADRATIAATGGSVDEGAVQSREATGTPPQARTNRIDEEGATPTQTTTQITPGRTDGPDLIEGRIEEIRNDANVVTGHRAAYRFDERLKGTPVSSLFFGYTAEGRKARCLATTLGEGTTSTTFGDDTVRCTRYEFVDATGTDLTSAQISSLVLLTVERGAVTARDDGPTNPIGATPASGTKGTPHTGAR